MSDIKINSSNLQNINTNNSVDKRIDRANFNQLFQTELDKTEKLKFSNHAEKRMSERNINLSEEEITKISEGIEKAGEKGANDALVLYNDVVLIASVRNNTIITAMDKNNTDNNIITNVDSAIFIN